MGRPKPLLPIGSTTFTGRILNAVRESAIPLTAIAVAHDAHLDRGDKALADVTVLRNARPRADGQIGSIRCAIDHVINRPVEALLIWPVDHPSVRPATASAIASAFLRTRMPIVLPTFERRRGHPVLFSRTVFDELMAAPVEGGARTVVHADPARVLEVPVDDPGILEDIDTPADYQALLHRINARRETN